MTNRLYKREFRRKVEMWFDRSSILKMNVNNDKMLFQFIDRLTIEIMQVIMKSFIFITSLLNMIKCLSLEDKYIV